MHAFLLGNGLDCTPATHDPGRGRYAGGHSGDRRTMARRLLDLRGVPEEEAAELRAALNRENVDYYELPPSAFGISAGSIWIRHDRDFEHARGVFDRFQADWAENARRGPRVEPLRVQLRRRPWRILGFIAAALFVLLLMMWPIAELWAACPLPATR
jgi:hypothetical protein